MRAPGRRSRVRTLVASRRGWVAAVCLLVLAAAVVTGSLLTGGYRPSDVQLSSGTVWLPSPQGVVTLVDGPSEQVVGNLQPKDTGDDPPEVIQLAGSALVIDKTAGEIARIDGATWAVTRSVRLGGGSLEVLVDDDRAVVIDRETGTATEVHLDTLEPGGPVSLGVRPGEGQAVLDGSGDV
jgi:hypothetical protein